MYPNNLKYSYDIKYKGANIVLVARSKDKLEELAKEIRDRFKVQTKIVIIDFSKKDIDYSELTQTVSSLDVSILVNNVGINTEIPDRYLDTPYNEILDMVHVNVDSLVEVTKAVAPSIVKKDGKGEGLIVNLSSYSASSPVPHMAGYSGTKAFINAFSAALRYEYPNLEVLALNPMLVASQMTHISEKRASLLVCTGERLAQDTYKVYGAPFVPNTYSPYLPHSIQTYIVSLLPEKLQAYLGRNQMITVKKKLIAKFAREGKKQ